MLICTLFSRNNVCKKLSFPRVSFGDLLLSEKQKKPFVLLNDEVIRAWYLLLVLLFIQLCNSLVVASLAQANKVLNGLDLSLFCRDTRAIRGRSMFFSGLFLYSFQNKNSYLKNHAVEAAKSNRLSFPSKDSLQKIFCTRYFSKTKRKSTKTITQRCFSCQNKSVCQKLARSCKK